MRDGDLEGFPIGVSGWGAMTVGYLEAGFSIGNCTLFLSTGFDAAAVMISSTFLGLSRTDSELLDDR